MMAKHNEDGQIIGNIFNIQRFTIHDGPGIRTEIFFKGCPLRCVWCSNPESMRQASEVGVYPEHCVGIDKCGRCLPMCSVEPGGALVVEENKVVRINRKTCIGCLACAKACPNDSLKIFGEWMTVDEVMRPILSDRNFYTRSGGGITLSGGDALLQWEFALELLKRCKNVGIHTCVESEMHTTTSVLDEVMPFTDLWIVDMKLMDSAKHREYTCVGLDRILSNIKYLVSNKAKLVIRIPVIKGINDHDVNIQITARFIIDELHGRITQLQLLPYRLLGEDKYEALGLKFRMMTETAPDRDEYEPRIRHIAEIFQDQGIPAVAGTTTKFQ